MNPIARSSTAHTLQDGRFLVLETLGRGGMATVYRAFDRVEQRIVALKTLVEIDRAGPGHPLSAEFEAWTMVRHPNVVRVHELCRARRGPLPAGAPYLVLEYFPGRPAHEALPPGRCSPHLLEEFARRVLYGLLRVHQAGLVHRDLKPGNVLVRRARCGPGRIKLTDFGLAEPTGLAEEPGRLSGSLPYVSPEAVVGGSIDARADLYGLGMLLFLLATGRPAAEGRTPNEVVRWHLCGSMPDPRVLRSEVSERLACFIRRCASRLPEHRPADTEEALFLLGGPPPGRTSFGGRNLRLADRACLRLALDAARLGAVRFLPVPRDGRAREWVREARVQAQTRGIGFHSVRAGPSAGAGLARLVYRLLLELGGDVRRMIEKHRLHDGLPLGLLGGLPVWDRMKLRGIDLARDESARRAIARGIVGFLVESGRRRTRVIHIEPAASRDPLVGDVVGLLRLEMSERERPARGRGGLLLLIPDQKRSETIFEPPT